jgi:hypothetical protein
MRSVVKYHGEGMSYDYLKLGTKYGVTPREFGVVKGTNIAFGTQGVNEAG